MIASLKRTSIATWILTIVIACSLPVTAYALWQRSEQQSSTNHIVCVAINNLNKTITDSLERSRATIPKLEYYRQHPAELKQQLAEIDRSLLAFRPRTCL